MSDLIRLLDAAKAGDRQAPTDLLPLVYYELQKLAAAKMAAEAPGRTLDATALVHEAYLQLVGDLQFNGRRHFLAAAALFGRMSLPEIVEHLGISLTTAERGWRYARAWLYTAMADDEKKPAPE